jgi:hypothetical protein
MNEVKVPGDAGDPSSGSDRFAEAVADALLDRIRRDPAYRRALRTILDAADGGAEEASE